MLMLMLLVVLLKSFYSLRCLLELGEEQTEQQRDRIVLENTALSYHNNAYFTPRTSPDAEGL